MANKPIEDAVINKQIEAFTAADIARLFQGRYVTVAEGEPLTLDRLDDVLKMDELLPPVKALLPFVLDNPQLRESLSEAYAANLFHVRPADELAEAFLALGDERTLYRALDVASRHHGAEFVDAVLATTTIDERHQNILLFNAMLRQDNELLKVLQRHVGEANLRALPQVSMSLAGSNETRTFTQQQINDALDNVSPTLGELPHGDIKAMNIEARLHVSGAKDIAVDGVLTEEELEALRAKTGLDKDVDIRQLPLPQVIRELEKVGGFVPALKELPPGDSALMDIEARLHTWGSHESVIDGHLAADEIKRLAETTLLREENPDLMELPLPKVIQAFQTMGAKTPIMKDLPDGDSMLMNIEARLHMLGASDIAIDGKLTDNEIAALKEKVPTLDGAPLDLIPVPYIIHKLEEEKTRTP